MRAPALALGVLVLGCSDGFNPNPRPPVDRIEVLPGNQLLTSITQTLQLEARAYTVQGELIPDQDFTWNTSAPGVVTVSRVGLVRVRGDGESTVSARLDDVIGSVTITVDLNGGTPEP